jgi:hypothetical protein
MKLDIYKSKEPTVNDKSATQMATEQRQLERSFGPVPHGIQTEEDYLRWMLSEIHRRAREDAEPYVKRLVEIENQKPPKPIVIPLDQWPEHLTKPLRET